jgi:hypothetical protein
VPKSFSTGWRPPSLSLLHRPSGVKIHQNLDICRILAVQYGRFSGRRSGGGLGDADWEIEIDQVLGCEREVKFRVAETVRDHVRKLDASRSLSGALNDKGRCDLLRIVFDPGVGDVPRGGGPGYEYKPDEHHECAQRAVHKRDPVPPIRSAGGLPLASDIEGDVSVGVTHPGRLRQEGGCGKTLIGFAAEGRPKQRTADLPRAFFARLRSGNPRIRGMLKYLNDRCQAGSDACRKTRNVIRHRPTEDADRTQMKGENLGIDQVTTEQRSVRKTQTDARNSRPRTKNAT